MARFYGKEVRKEMISMSKAQSIREMRREGETITAISQKLSVSRDTVYKYLGKDDFSPKPPAPAGGASIMDQYRRIIEGYLEEDSRNWRKQRHTGRKIYERLRDEHGCGASESTVRHYVTKVKRERGEQKSQFLTLVWHPGEAQVDFGEADFYVMGVRRRLYFMAVSFPYSNVGLAQLFPGQNAECVCQGLKNVFEYLGGVPLRLVFDNATGVGRKVSDTFRTTDMFGAFAAHYGFSFSFCNPNSGHEKGNVERKVCFIRNSLFVPVPVVTSVESYNRHLPDRCMALSKDRAHWLKGEPEGQLFVEDQFALSGLPAKPFEVVKYVEPKTDRQGRFRLDGAHTYSTAPSLASARIVVGVTAHKVKVYDAAGALVCEHARAYGDAPTDSEEPASQLALLCTRPNAWTNSQVRASLPEALRAHMDSLSKSELRAELRVMRNQAASSGYGATVDAMSASLAGTGRVDEASVALAAARAASGTVTYEDRVDLGAYDAAFASIGGGETWR